MVQRTNDGRCEGHLPYVSYGKGIRNSPMLVMPICIAYAMAVAANSRVNELCPKKPDNMKRNAHLEPNVLSPQRLQRGESYVVSL